MLGPQRISYAQLWEQARRYAAVLAQEGVRPGDRIAVLMPNVPDFPRVYYAALSLGAVVVPVHGTGSTGAARHARLAVTSAPAIS